MFQYYLLKIKLSISVFLLLQLNGLFGKIMIIRYLKKTESKGIISALNINQAMEWDKYPTYSQYDSIMQSFKTLYPALCHLDTIGTSINGKLVLALKISDNAANDEESLKFSTLLQYMVMKPEVLF